MLGDRIRDLRTDNDLTVKKLSEIINVADSTLSGYENGVRNPDYSILIKIADYFDVSVDYLLGRTKVLSMAGTPPKEIKKDIANMIKKIIDMLDDSNAVFSSKKLNPIAIATLKELLKTTLSITKKINKE